MFRQTFLNPDSRPIIDALELKQIIPSGYVRYEETMDKGDERGSYSDCCRIRVGGSTREITITTLFGGLLTWTDTDLTNNIRTKVIVIGNEQVVRMSGYCSHGEWIGAKRELLHSAMCQVYRSRAGNGLSVIRPFLKIRHYQQS